MEFSSAAEEAFEEGDPEERGEDARGECENGEERWWNEIGAEFLPLAFTCGKTASELLLPQYVGVGADILSISGDGVALFCVGASNTWGGGVSGPTEE